MTTKFRALSFQLRMLQFLNYSYRLLLLVLERFESLKALFVQLNMGVKKQSCCNV